MVIQHQRIKSKLCWSKTHFYINNIRDEFSSKTNGHLNLINILLFFSNEWKIFFNYSKITDQMNTSMELRWAVMIRFKDVRKISSSWLLWSLSMDLLCLAQKKTYWSPFLGPGILLFFAAIFNMWLQTSTQWRAHGHHSSMTQKLENAFLIWMEHLTKHKLTACFHDIDLF